jgi:hypothetical protein
MALTYQELENEFVAMGTDDRKAVCRRREEIWQEQIRGHLLASLPPYPKRQKKFCAHHERLDACSGCSHPGLHAVLCTFRRICRKILIFSGWKPVTAGSSKSGSTL